jgi:hypothetical protein
MEEFTVEEVIDYHVEILLASDREEDRGLEGRLLTPGNLDFVIDSATVSLIRLREQLSFCMVLRQGMPSSREING